MVFSTTVLREIILPFIILIKSDWVKGSSTVPQIISYFLSIFFLLVFLSCTSLAETKYHFLNILQLELVGILLVGGGFYITGLSNKAGYVICPWRCEQGLMFMQWNFTLSGKLLSYKHIQAVIWLYIFSILHMLICSLVLLLSFTYQKSKKQSYCTILCRVSNTSSLSQLLMTYTPYW